MRQVKLGYDGSGRPAFQLTALVHEHHPWLSAHAILLQAGVLSITGAVNSCDHESNGESHRGNDALQPDIMLL